MDEHLRLDPCFKNSVAFVTHLGAVQAQITQHHIEFSLTVSTTALLLLASVVLEYY